MLSKRSAALAAVAWMIAVAVLGLLFACVRQAPDQPLQVDFQRSITSGGFVREYWVHLPPTYTQSSNLHPLILCLHGSGGSGEGMKHYSGMDSAADEYDAIVVYPTAYGGNWAEGIEARPDGMGVDDVAFVRDLLSLLREELHLDSTRIYAVGFSQGASFAHRLVVDLPGIFQAYATVSASISHAVAQRYQTPAPVPFS